MTHSICILSWNRPESFEKVWENNIATCLSDRPDTEVLVCDNGSFDFDKILKVCKGAKNLYVRRNHSNEGNPRSLNQLLIRTKGDIVTVMGNDLLLCQDWYKRAEKAVHQVPDCGLIGFNLDKPDQRLDERGFFFLTDARQAIIGCWSIPRKVLEYVGSLDERFHPYGFWDGDYNYRVNIAGFKSCVVSEQHTCILSDDPIEYLEMKKIACKQNKFLLKQATNPQSYVRFGIYRPWPAMTEAI